MLLRLGDRDLNSISDDFGAIIRRVRRTHVHPKYNGKQKRAYFDVALWEVAPRITFNSFVRPLCLPPAPSTDVDKYAGRGVTLTGERVVFCC